MCLLFSESPHLQCVHMCAYYRILLHEKRIGGPSTLFVCRNLFNDLKNSVVHGKKTTAILAVDRSYVALYATTTTATTTTTTAATATATATAAAAATTTTTVDPCTICTP